MKCKTWKKRTGKFATLSIHIQRDVETLHFQRRLHREALKQSATDPLSGKIDVGILTTGLSTAARKKQADLVASIKENLKKKGNTPTVPWQKLFTEIKENSQIVSFDGNLIANCAQLQIFSNFSAYHTRTVRGRTKDYSG